MLRKPINERKKKLARKDKDKYYFQKNYKMKQKIKIRKT
jgi:hypothetical protein